MYKISLRQAGVSLVEVLVAIGIISVMLIAVGLSVTTYVDARTKLLDNTKAVYLAEEGYEILRTIRDADWNTLSALTVGTTYYLDVTDTTLAITGTVEVVDTDFTRSFVLNTAYRDNTTDDIVFSGGSADADTRMLTVTVVGPADTITFEAVMTNLHAI